MDGCKNGSDGGSKKERADAKERGYGLGSGPAGIRTMRGELRKPRVVVVER